VAKLVKNCREKPASYEKLNSTLTSTSAGPPTSATRYGKMISDPIEGLQNGSISPLSGTIKLSKL
jgi:hypothetical protein